MHEQTEMPVGYQLAHPLTEEDLLGVSAAGNAVAMRAPAVTKVVSGGASTGGDAQIDAGWDF